MGFENGFELYSPGAFKAVDKKTGKENELLTPTGSARGMTFEEIQAVIDGDLDADITIKRSDEIEKDIESDEYMRRDGEDVLEEAQRGGTQSAFRNKNFGDREITDYGRAVQSQLLEHGGHPSETPRRKTEAYAEGAHDKKMRNWDNARAQMTGGGEMIKPMASHQDIGEADETGKKFKDAA